MRISAKDVLVEEMKMMEGVKTSVVVSLLEQVRQ